MGGPSPKMEYICQQCNAKFIDKKRYDRVVKFCSHDCYSKSKKGKTTWNKGVPMKAETKAIQRKQRLGKRVSPETEFTKENHSGEKNQRWNGGVQKMFNGYVQILSPHHPHASVRGYIGEHILVAEKHLGRFLTSEEVVHHINRKRNDNRPENLYVFPSQKEHMQHHFNIGYTETMKISNLPPLS